MVVTTAPERAASTLRVLPALVAHPHSARIIDGALMGLIVVRTSLPGMDLPVAQTSLIAMVLICLTRRPTRSFATAWWFPATLGALWLFLVAETALNGIDPTRRAINIATLLMTALFLASGRIDVGSAIKGLGAGLIVNAVLFYVGVAPDAYQGRLTGFLQDKNASALYLAVGAFLLVLVTTKVWQRVTLAAGAAVALAATDSRTTMAAAAIALAWLLVSGRLSRPLQLVALTVGVLVFFWADKNLSEFGAYAVTREGSDSFRSRIDAASALKAAAAPWYGSGLGQATVSLDSGTWFFHNSYEGLLVEGGIVALVVVLALYAIASLGIARRGTVDPLSLDARAITAATLVLALCASRLGEVFFAPIGFVLLGIGLARLLPPITGSPRPAWLGTH